MPNATNTASSALVAGLISASGSGQFMRGPNTAGDSSSSALAGVRLSASGKYSNAPIYTSGKQVFTRVRIKGSGKFRKKGVFNV